MTVRTPMNTEKKEVCFEPTVKAEDNDTKKEEEPTERKVNPWQAHVKAFRAAHPDMSFKQVLVEAKKTYTKVSK